MIFAPPGVIVSAGASRLHLRISGRGTPAVILEAGIAASSLSWALVHPALAEFTTVVSYDRAGLGWSGPATTPRTPGVIASELRMALDQARVAPPFIVVGHSFGGLIAQRFATLYKADVAGIVLLDALDPSMWVPMTPARDRMLDRGIRLARRGAVLARLGIVGAALRILLSGNRALPRLAARVTSGRGGSGFTGRLAGEIRKLPRELWPAIAWQWSQPKNFDGMARHLEDLRATLAEMAVSEIDPAIPVTSLVAGETLTGRPHPHWNVIQVPDGGHWLQLDRPDLVIEAVREMIRQRPS